MLLHLTDLHAEIVLAYLSGYIIEQCLLIKVDLIAYMLILDFKALEMCVGPYHTLGLNSLLPLEMSENIPLSNSFPPY